MKTVKGAVEAVGTKFNGSLKVNGEWLNLKKGVKNPAKAGDTVELVLESWTFKDKTGENITSIVVNSSAPVSATVSTEGKLPLNTDSTGYVPSKGRDFDKEAKGKTVCSYVSALLSNPSVDTNDIKSIFDKAEKLMKLTFGE